MANDVEVTMFETNGGDPDRRDRNGERMNEMRSVTYWHKKQNSPGLGVAETIMFWGRVHEATKCKKMF